MSRYEMSLEKYFLILRTHARQISVIFVSAVAIAGVITYFTPEMYSASTSIHFDFKAANPMDNQGNLLEEDAYLYTQIDIIKSQNVSEKVDESLTTYEKERLISAIQAEQTIIDKLRIEIQRTIDSLLTTDETANQEDDDNTVSKDNLDISSPYSWITRRLHYTLKVEPRFNSRIVDIAYSSTDPQIATFIANRIADAYIATNLQMTIDPARKTSTWFGEQIKALRQKLENAQSALTAYQQKERIISSDQRLDTENERLQELSSQLVVAQQATRNAVTEQIKLGKVLETGDSLLTFGPVFSNSVVQNIKSEIRTLEGELVQVSTSLGKNHPKYKRISSELYAARMRLKNEITNITDGINNTAELAKDRELDLFQALNDQKQLVLSLKQEHDIIAVLQRDVESAQAVYNAALSQQNSTNMQSMIDQTNVSIIDLANVPEEPSTPSWIKNLILGGFGGLLLGIGIAIFSEITNRRIHSKEDLIYELELPLLGHLKKF